MNYQYDLSDFKRYLNDKNKKYRVDGLVFWQNRIPLPIDLFNQMFNDADSILYEYAHHLIIAAIVFKHQANFEEQFCIQVTELPSSKLNSQKGGVVEWITSIFKLDKELKAFPSNIAEVFGLDEFTLSNNKLADALSHQGKKYARLYMPEPIRQIYIQHNLSCVIGSDNTDMFGNVIADKYNIYRSGFSDALALIFNALLEFRILCSGRGSHLSRLDLKINKSDGIDVRIGKTRDGSLWEPGYEDEHFVTISAGHPLIRKAGPASNIDGLFELLYYLSEFENNQFSDTQRKLIENMRQEVSRGLWIRND